MSDSSDPVLGLARFRDVMIGVTSASQLPLRHGELSAVGRFPVTLDNPDADNPGWIVWLVVDDDADPAAVVADLSAKLRPVEVGALLAVASQPGTPRRLAAHLVEIFGEATKC